MSTTPNGDRIGPAPSVFISLWWPRGRGYVLALLSAVATLLLSLKLAPVIGGSHLLMVFLIPIILSAYVGGLGPGLAATVLVALLTDYFILPPARSLYINHPADGLRWGLLVLMGLLITLINEALHRSRRRAEESGRRFAATLDSIGEAVISTDPQGRITLLNKEAERLTGWPNDQAVGQPLMAVFSIIDEVSRQPVEDAVKKALRGGNPLELANHTLLVARNGNEFPIEDNGAPIKQGNGDITGVVLVFRDCTLKKRAEMALRASEDRFRSYFENAPLAVFVADRTGRFVDCNPAAAQMLGYDPDILRGMTIAEIHPAGDREQVVRAWSVLAEQRQLEGEFQFQRRDGKLIWAWLRAVMLADGRSIGFGQDITSHKQAKELQVRLATAVDQAVEDIIITDADGTILYVNPAFERITGYAAGEVMGGNPRILKSGKHDAEFYHLMWDTLKRGGVWSGRLVNKRKNGTLYEEEATISPIRDATGKIINYVGVRRDVTREVDLENHLRHAQKMEAIGQLAGGIAHDFNNLLTAIRGNASLLMLSQPSPSTEVAECANQIVVAAERGANLTRQLLMFGRKQAIQPVRLDLNAVVARMTRLLRHTIAENISLVSTHAASLPAIQADPGMIEQILLNLVVNSRDAMPQGGTLTIHTDTEILEPDTAGPYSGQAVGLYVRLTVTDTGCGIAPEDLPHIFEPFFTTKEVGLGTGLGLATVHGIVQQHNGRITVSSHPGQGTTFCIYFPALAGGRNGQTTTLETVQLPRGTETILVVEDEVLVRLSVTKMLQRFGYTVLPAESGAAALRIWEKNKAGIHLLLTDLVMPGSLSGYELARQLQADKPQLKVIFTSGYNGDLTGERPAMTDGCNFLQKPYAPQKLAEALRKNLDPA